MTDTLTPAADAVPAIPSALLAFIDKVSKRPMIPANPEVDTMSATPICRGPRPATDRPCSCCM